MTRSGRRLSEPFELDSFDLEIFRELQRDGRAPFVAIAERLGVSEAHVRRRTARLTDAQIFSITAIADPKAIGIDCMAWLGIVAQHGEAARVAEALVALPEIDYVVHTAGEFNVMAEAACRSSEVLYGLLRRIRTIPGVQRTETSVYLNLLCQQFQWSLNGTSQAIHAPASSQLEPLDVDIVGELQRDGRASFRQIAKHLSVSERVVSTRFGRLIDEGALQVIAVGDPATFGFDAMAWLGMRVREGAVLEDMAAALSTVPEIDYVVIPTGRYDLMAEVVCRDRSHLLYALEHGVGRIKEIVEVDSFIYLRLLYRSAIGAWGASRSVSVASRELPTRAVASES
jgi:Lrp/AsnC family transcriptional regulator for asnA, asnC and gidA